jgi:enamine deaminase RidA (YjgF/YER057c/UK114 family)
MKSLRLSALAAILASVALAGSAQAAPEIVRVGPPESPISGIVVVKNVGGVDIAYQSGIPGSAKDGDTEAQTMASLTKIKASLESQGFKMGDVVMMRVCLVGDPAMGGKMDFMGMMKAYKMFFGTPEQPNKPARITTQIAALGAPGALVEIEVQAVKPHM